MTVSGRIPAMCAAAHRSDCPPAIYQPSKHGQEIGLFFFLGAQLVRLAAGRKTGGFFF
jgi:hypothetical protein